MYLLPFHTLKLSTSQSVDAIHAQLHELVDPLEEPTWFTKTDKQFRGSFSEEGFRLRRIIYYKNSFLPIVNGEFQEEPYGTTIAISMYPHPVALIVILLMIGLLVSVMISDFANGFVDSNRVSVGFIIIGLSAIVLSIGFWIEAKRAESILVDALDLTPKA